MSRRRKKQLKKQRQLENKKKVPAQAKQGTGGIFGDALRRALKTAGFDVTNNNPSPEGVAQAGSEQQKSAKTSSPEVQAGSATQLSSRQFTDEVELVIGLDFGTSCTKVVIQDVARRAGYAVPFNQVEGLEMPFLLPTAVYLDADGEFNLEGYGKSYSGLKQNLMNIVADDSQKTAKPDRSLLPPTIAYLALVFRISRAWFFEAHGPDYANRKMKWRVNVGLPASRFDDANMPILYRSIVRKAWFASVLNEPITSTLASRLQDDVNLDAENPEAALSPGAIGAFPEVVAAVQGYAKSPERQEGLHLLVDVGATTMDVTCFRLMQYEHEDQYPIFFATVTRLGGFELFAYRAGIVSNNVTEAIDAMRAQMNGLTAAENPLKIKFSLNDDDRTEIDGKFCNQVGEGIWNVIGETKRRRDPTAPEWKTRLPTFLCGGAASTDIYQQALNRIDTNNGWQGHLEFRGLQLPRVVDAPGLSPGQRHRLVVAFGLSFRPLDIGELIPQSGIPDPEIGEQQKQFTDAFVGAEMV